MDYELAYYDCAAMAQQAVIIGYDYMDQGDEAQFKACMRFARQCYSMCRCCVEALEPGAVN
jgi:hypothetical protein